jgi:hypothetical protein
MAFVIPLGAKPPQCYNAITPNDMFSSLTCAFSGAFLIAGGLAVTVWSKCYRLLKQTKNWAHTVHLVFIRALSMHLQICWDIVPGRRFFYFSQAAGWGVAAVLFTVTMAVTGVSFRFGDACHVNSKHSVADFWGPLLGMAGVAGLIQVMTFLYCIKVYIQNMWSDEKTETNTSAGLPSYTSSIRAHSIRAVYRRMKKVLWLQWRSITIVIFLLVDIIFFAIIWIELDRKIQLVADGDINDFMPFLLCLFESQGDKTKCFKQGQQVLVNESTAIAILMLLSVSLPSFTMSSSCNVSNSRYQLAGIQTGMMMSRSAMFSGWWELLTRRFKHNNKEFVSLDAKRFSSDQRTFELLKMDTPDPEVAIAAPSQPYTTDMRSPEYLNNSNIDVSEKQSTSPRGGDATREWRKPTMSFAGPQAPSNATKRMDWEQPVASRSRGGLGLHPPQSPSPNAMTDVYGNGMENRI